MSRLPRPVSFGGLAVLGLLTLACSGDPYGEKRPAAGGAAVDAKGDQSPVLLWHQDGKPVGKVFDDAPVSLVKLLGQTPQVAEQQLGPPMPDSKGGMRDSCVRHLPERTWFRCKHAWQRYSDKTGTFGEIRVIYEDGKVAGVSFDRFPAGGPFDPVKALRKVGLELPGEPKVENPDAGVTTWSWWNASARLVVYGRQYRVLVSTVDGTWERAKVDIILNDALSESEKARVFDPGSEPPPE